MADTEDPDVIAEEEKLSRLLNKKAKLKFEEKRQTTLQSYQQQTGKSVPFQLQTPQLVQAEVISTPGIVPTAVAKTEKPAQEENSGGTAQENEYLKWREEQRRREAEEKQREQEEELRRQERAQQQGSQSNYGSSSSLPGFTPSGSYKSSSGGYTAPSYKPPTSFVPTSSFNGPSSSSRPGTFTRSNSSSNWREQQQQKEREEQLRREEEERRRREKAQQVVLESSELNQVPTARPQSLSWKEQQQLREFQDRQRREEEERRRLEKAQQVIQQGRGELEEYERRKQAEEERKRQELAMQEQLKHEATKATVPCKSCTKVIDINDAQYVRGQVYCSLCAPRAAMGATGNCASCNRPLGFSIAKAQNKKYHPECLICFGCGSNLDTGFRAAFDKLWCVNCRPFKPVS